MFNRDYRVLRSVLYKQLGYKGDKIPAICQGYITNVKCPLDYNGVKTVTLDLRLFPSEPQIVIHNLIPRMVKTSRHRMFAKCPKCQLWIPLGRLHQHVGTKRCTSKVEGGKV